MKLAILILFLATCFGLLVWLLIPSKKTTHIKRKTLQRKSISKPAAGKKQLPQTQEAKKAEDKIIMEEMRNAVRRYAIQNPGATAQVLQNWIKKKK